MGVLQTLRLGPNGELLLPSALRAHLRLEPGDLVEIGVDNRTEPTLTLKAGIGKPGARRFRPPSKMFEKLTQPVAVVELEQTNSNESPASKQGAVEDLIGCVGYNGPSIPAEDMDAAVGQAIAEQWRRE